MRQAMRRLSLTRFHAMPAALANCILLFTSVALLLLAQHVLIDWLTLD